MDKIDLLTLVDQGGCSAKLPAEGLAKALAGLPKMVHPNLLVDIETHDDGGVYKITDDYALIQTTDFFPPVCSDAYDFGQVAAANALSDVYAMGGEVLTAMNLMMFPEDQPLEVLAEILRGGQDKVVEAGGVMMGGHTITDAIPKYGLAVTGFVHPDKIITNSHARPGNVLILTKPLGTGIIISAWKNKLINTDIYRQAVKSMKQLNRAGGAIMQQMQVRTATDITGFGLAGHALKMAQASGVSMRFYTNKLPIFGEVLNLIEMGVIPGAAFRNKDFAGSHCYFDPSIDYNHKMLFFDAQTSGGLMMCVASEKVDAALEELHREGYPHAAVIGEVIEKKEHSLLIR
jgi:selenide,water dikinase